MQAGGKVAGEGIGSRLRSSVSRLRNNANLSR